MNKKSQLSPKNYIIQKVQQLPTQICLASTSSYEESKNGLETMIIVKQMPSGKYIIFTYMLDVYCLGVKNTSYHFAFDDDDFKKLMASKEEAGQSFRQVSEKFVTNFVFGALDYAEDLGFAPHKDFALTKYGLDEDLVDDTINDIVFGKEGRPYYISGPYDNPQHIINKLNKNVGEGNFDVLVLAQDDFLEGGLYYDDEDKDDDDDEEFDDYEEVDDNENQKKIDKK